ncbi:MAG: response regulator [Pseudonocardiaceae bacterium]
MTPLRIVLVDDHEMVRAGLKAMLASYYRQVRVVGEAGDAETARRVVAGLDPDVVLADVRLGRESGLELCRDLIAECPERKVVLLTVHDDEQYLFQAMQAGAAGYLLKRIDGPELIEHLHRVRAGGVALDAALGARAEVSAARLQAGQFWPGAHLGLTQRESEVLGLMVNGSSNRAIAAELVVGEETVKSHIRGIYRKLDVTDRASAVATALREGLYR